MELLIELFLPLSLAVIMLSLGIGLTVGDFARVVQVPRAFLAGAAAQMIVLPTTAFCLLMIVPLEPELALGVMILSFCPGGVTSNVLVKFARGALALSITLTAVVSLLAVVTIPILVAWMAEVFLGASTEVDVSNLAIAVFLITTLPVAIGVAIRRFAPAVAGRIERPLSLIANLFFVIILVGAIAAGAQTLLANALTLAPLLMALNVGMLGIGLLIGWISGLSFRERIAIALEAGVQNAALGITLGGLLADASGALPGFTLPSAVYGVTMYLVVAPFVIWARRSLTPMSPEPAG
ncbi:MAG: bile acid:sodium symporter family protein [Pseudomonadota bacterium]